MREYPAVLPEHLHVAESSYDHDAEFVFGLDLIIDGLDRLRHA